MIIKMVSWTRTKVIECDSYHIEKLGNQKHRWQIMKDATQGDTNGCILDQVMEDWAEDENLKVFVTENGKTVDSYDYPYSLKNYKCGGKQICQIPENTIVATLKYNGIGEEGIDMTLDEDFTDFMKSGGFKACGTGFDLSNQVRDLVFEKEII